MNVTASAATAPARGLLSGLARHWTIWREAWRAENARPKRTLQAAEQDFLPAAIEILEKPASPVGRATIWSLCALFVIAVGWAIVGRIDIVAVANGKVVPQGRTKVVQPLELGVVRALHVRDGDTVKAGQPLIDLDPTDAAADHDRLERERVARALDVARLDSLLGGGPGERPLTAPADADPILLEAARRLLDAQWHERTARLAALDGEIERRRAELRVTQTEIERFNATLPLLRDRSDGLTGLSDNTRRMVFCSSVGIRADERHVVPLGARRAEMKRSSTRISHFAHHLIALVTISLFVLAIANNVRAQERSLESDFSLKNIEKPTTAIGLLRHLKIAADDGLLLREGFYAENNITQLSGGSRVKWDQTRTPRERWGEVLDFGEMIAPFVDAGHAYSGIVLFFRADIGVTGRASARWHASFRGPNNVALSDVEAVFGTDWNEQVYERPFHSSPPATRTHGNMRIIYVVSGKGIQGEYLFGFKPDATIDWADITVKENPQ